MIIGFFGDMRQGKTLIAVKTLRELYREGYQIYSNIWLSFPYYNLTLEYCLDIVKGKAKAPDDAVFFIDEITAWLDSRRRNDTQNILTFLLLQNGKMGKDKNIGLYFLYTTQFPRLIDIRLWLTTVIKVLCFKDNFNNEIIIKEKWIIDKLEGLIVIEKYTLAKRYYNLYNTSEVVHIPKEYLK